ncbi:hypothetical protein IKG20_01955, partial [Candidatus Saccharibacteria bacterium]|nr:hypothetical protein [Candidatus Saccharibacteria bacterium]
MTKKRRRIITVFSILITVLCLAFSGLNTKTVYAEGYAGGGNEGSSASCTNYPCYSGATWIYFTIIGEGEIKVGGEEIASGCRDYGGFWFAFKRWAYKKGGSRYLANSYSTREGGKNRVNSSYINSKYYAISDGQYDSAVVNPQGTISDVETLISTLKSGYLVYSGGTAIDNENVNISWFCAGSSATFSASSSAPTSIENTTWDSTNKRFVGNVNTDSYTATFTHTISRTDTDNDPSSAGANSSIYQGSGDNKTWKKNYSPVLGGDTTTGTETADSTISVDPGQSKVVCQHLDYTSKVKIDVTGTSYGPEWSSTTEACVTIYRPLVIEAQGETKATALGKVTPAAKTHSDPTSTSITPAGGSKVTDYSISFQHRITIGGYNNKNIKFGFNIDRKIGSGSWTNVASGTKSLSTSDNNTGYAILRSIDDSKYSFKLPNFGDKLEVCERLTLYDNYQTFTNASDSSPASKSSTGKTSMSCATITRDTPKRHYITATSKVADDLGVDYTNKPNDVSYAVKSKRTAKFMFNLSNTYSGQLSTNYGIDYKINGSESINYVTGSTNTPVSIPFNATVDIRPGEKVQVCARIHFNPADYYAHTQGGGLEGLNVTRYSDDSTSTNKAQYRCIWFGHPAPVEFPDPGITVTAESSAAVKNSNEAVLDNNIGAYVVKSADVNVSYYHQFERGDVRHTDKAKTPTEDVSVNYRFYRPNHDFSSKELNSTYIKPNLTIKNNSKSAVFESNQTDKLKNDNTHITGLNVSKDPQEVCQSVHYLSDKYESYGTYWAIDGVRLGQLAPNLSGAGDLISSRVVRTNSVGKSSKACVKLIRPFNFKVPSITTPGNTTPANPSASVNATFTINVERNTKDFLLTDLPKSPESQVELISFVVSGKPGDGDLAG